MGSEKLVKPLAVNTNNLPTYSQLVQISESTSSLKSSAGFVIDALNDWPELNLKEPSSLISILRNEISGELNLKNISEFLSTLHPNTDAWKIEAIESLIQLYGMANTDWKSADKTLEYILQDIVRTNF